MNQLIQVKRSAFTSTNIHPFISSSPSHLTHEEYADIGRRFSQIEQKQNLVALNAQPSIPTEQKRLSLKNQNSSLIIQQANQNILQKEIEEANRVGDKKLALLLIALQTGNMEFAMLLFSSLETKEAAQITSKLAHLLLQAQDRRRQIAQEMDKLTGEDDQKGIHDLQARMQDVSDTIQLLSSCIQEIQDQKNRTTEFANNYIHNENQTSMNIARGLRG